MHHCNASKSPADSPNCLESQDGENYERAYIQRWIDEKRAELVEAKQEQEWDSSNQRAARRLMRGILSPKIGVRLEHTQLTPNNELKREAWEWAKCHSVEQKQMMV